jgi:hypothetical protein
MDYIDLFRLAPTVANLARYMGLVSNEVERGVELLRGSELEAGLRALKQAQMSDRERHDLLREARARFNKAISLEREYRLALTYVSLAICHHHLDDSANASAVLREFSLIPKDVFFPQLSRKSPMRIATAFFFGNTIPHDLATAKARDEWDRVSHLQKKSAGYAASSRP